MPPLGRGLRAGLRAELGAFLALDAEADERADLAAELDCLFLRQVAEVGDLDVAVRVLVDGERVDHAHRVALAQLLELRDDLAVELRVREPEDDELNRSDCHTVSFGLVVPVAWRMAAARSVRHRPKGMSGRRSDGSQGS